MDGATPAAAPAAPSTNLNGTSAPPPFLSKTYEMVDDPSTDAIVSWGPNNNSFVVWNTPEFARDLLPKYFKHNNFSSFVRQLNTYGFRKVDPDRWEFANEGFLRGQKHLLKNISRRKPSQVQSQQPHPPPPQPPTAVPACVEVGKFGLEEEIEQLKRDKNVLMQELIRLRQQQQTTDHQLHTLGERLHGMEQRQQQMMAFLAKAMQSPGFLAQLVQQNDTANNRRITAAAGSKKRRYPNQAGTELDGGESSSSSSLHGQIVKYQPLINEAAKAMVMQILKLETLSGGGSDSFLVNNFSSALGSRDNNVGSAIRNSGVTLKEVPTTSGIPFLPSSSGFSSSSTSSPNMVNEPIIAPELSAIQGGAMSNGDSSSILSESFAVNEVDTGFVESIPPVAEGQNPIDLDSLGEDMDFLDEVENLPSIQDPFWEQFLTASPSPSPSPVDAGDNSNVQENSDMIPELENGWDKLQNMENLTEQMGHLTSEAKK